MNPSNFAPDDSGQRHGAQHQTSSNLYPMQGPYHFPNPLSNSLNNDLNSRPANYPSMNNVFLENSYGHNRMFNIGENSNRMDSMPPFTPYGPNAQTYPFSQHQNRFPRSQTNSTFPITYPLNLGKINPLPLQQQNVSPQPCMNPIFYQHENFSQPLRTNNQFPPKLGNLHPSPSHPSAGASNIASPLHLTQSLNGFKEESKGEKTEIQEKDQCQKDGPQDTTSKDSDNAEKDDPSAKSMLVTDLLKSVLGPSDNKVNENSADGMFGEIISPDAALKEINNEPGEKNPKFPTVKELPTVSSEDIEKRLASRTEIEKKHLNLKDVALFKKSHIYPAGVDKANFRKQTKRFIFEDGCLWYTTMTNGTPVKLKAIIEKEERFALIKMAHDGGSTSDEAAAMSGHRGRDAVFSVLSLHYHWQGMSRDIREYVRTCENCQRVNDAAFKVVPELRPVGVPSEVMKQVGVDLMDLGKTESGKRYAVVLIDYHSKWVEAEALEDKCATSVALFLHQVMCRHGVFKIQINDQGREFVNEVSEELFRLSGTRQRITSAYHPQANGLVERQNKTLKNFFKKTLLEGACNWDQCLQSVVFAHRTMVHASTKFSPYFVMYGRHPVLPLDLITQEENNDEDIDDPAAIGDFGNDDSEAAEPLDFDETEFKERLSGILNMRKNIDKKVTENIKKAQRKQKKDYDRRHHTPNNAWHVGDYVMIINKKNEGRKGGKMEMNRSEGYEIVEIDDLKRCTLKNNKSKLILKTKYPSVQLLPLVTLEGSKKRKLEIKDDKTKVKKQDVEADKKATEDADIEITGSIEASTYYYPVGPTWQRQQCKDKGFVIAANHKINPMSKPILSGPPLTFQQIEGDGNCFFRAIAFILTGKQDSHDMVRALLTSYMLAEEIKPVLAKYDPKLLGSKWRMHKVGTWATDLEIMAAAMWLNTTIYVYVTSKKEATTKGTWMAFRPDSLKKMEMDTKKALIKKAREVPSERAIYLANRGGVHYEPVLSVCESPDLDDKKH